MLTLKRLFLRNKTTLTSVNDPMVYKILKALLLSFENESINMPLESLEINLSMRAPQLATKRYK